MPINLTTRTKTRLIAIFLYSVGLVYAFSSAGLDGTSTQLAFANGPPLGSTGAPMEVTCNQADCHESFPLNPDTMGKLRIVGLPDNYEPGERYTVELSLTQPEEERRRWGFQATAISQESLESVGEFLITDPRNTQVQFGGPQQRQYVMHTLPGTGRGRTGGMTWTFDWLAPGEDVGDIGFYAIGNAANLNNLPTGDKVYTNSPAPRALVGRPGFFTQTAAAAEVVADPLGLGIAWGEFENDGRPDLFIAREGMSLLFSNNGDDTFTDITTDVRISSGVGSSRAAAWADFDDDDDLDLFVANDGQDFLFRNNSGRSFFEVAQFIGLDAEAPSWDAAWGDFNNDGVLDLFVVNDGQDMLNVNDGDGNFSQADPAQAGIVDDASGRAVAVADFDGDGNLDIFVANEGPDFLYRNNGDGTFAQVAEAAGLTDMAAGRGAAWADFDGDGNVDLFVANIGQDFLYRNNGDGTFEEVAAQAGMSDAAAGYAAAWADFDQDDDLDLFVANDGQDFLYQNNGDGTFTQVAESLGMTDDLPGRSVAWADYDQDGDLDVFVSNAEGEDFLYRNFLNSGL